MAEWNAGSDEIQHQFSCSLCDRKHMHVEAIKYCDECRSYLCGSCLEQHNSFPPMMGHRMREGEQMWMAANLRIDLEDGVDEVKIDSSAKQPDSSSMSTDTCPDHPGYQLDMYCRKHDTVCCSVCSSLQHKRCKDVEYVANMAVGVKESREYKDVIAEARRLKGDLRKALSSRKDDKSRLSMEFDDIVKATQAMVAALRKRTDDLEASTTAKVKTRHETLKAGINESIAFLTDTISKIERGIKADKDLPSDNECKVFVNMKILKQIKDLGKKKLKKLPSGTGSERLQFKFDHSIALGLSSHRELGEFLDEKKSNQQSQPYRLRWITKANVKVAGNRHRCCITGSCVLKSGELVLVDSDNRNLVRLDIDYAVRDSLKLPRSPYDVCVTGPDQVAVSLDVKRQIALVLVANTMQITRLFNVGENVAGLVCIQDYLYVCCEGINKSRRIIRVDSSSSDDAATSKKPSSTSRKSNYRKIGRLPRKRFGSNEDLEKFDSDESPEQSSGSETEDDEDSELSEASFSSDDCDAGGNKSGSIKVFSLSGKHLKTLRRTVANVKIVKEPRRINFDEERSLLYVSEFDEGLVVTDLEGKICSEMKLPNIRDPRCVCVISKDCLFVSHLYGIIQIDSRGKKIGSLIPGEDDSDVDTEDTEEPLSMCYDRNLGRLFITYSMNNKIEIYDIE